MSNDIFTNDFGTTLELPANSGDATITVVASPTTPAVASVGTQYRALVDTQNGTPYANTEIMIVTDTQTDVWTVQRAAESVPGGAQQGSPVAHAAGVDVTLIVTAGALNALGSAASSSVSSVFGRSGAVTAQSTDYAGFYDTNGKAAAASTAAISSAFTTTQTASVAAISVSEGYALTVAQAASVNAAAVSDPLGSAAAGSVNAVTVSESYAYSTTKAASVATVALIPSPVVNSIAGVSGAVILYSPNSSVGITTSGASVGLTAAGGGGGGSVSSVFGRTGFVTAQSTDYAAFYDTLGSAAAASTAAIASAFGTTQAASIAAIATSEAYADTSAHAASVAAVNSAVATSEAYADTSAHAASVAAVNSAFLTTQSASTAAINSAVATSETFATTQAQGASVNAVSVSEAYAYSTTKAASVATVALIPSPVVSTVNGLSGAVTFFSHNSTASIATTGASVDITVASGGGGGSVNSVFGRTGVVTAQSSDYASFYDTNGQASNASVAAINSAFLTTQAASTAAVTSAVLTSEAYALTTAQAASVNAAANITGSLNNESIIRANSIDQFAPAAANVNMNNFTLTNVAQGITTTQPATVGQVTQSQYPFVVSGCTWSASVGSLAASMSPGTISINGVLLSVASVSNTFTASKDTYVDFQDAGNGTATVSYNTAPNYGTSPALANGGNILSTLRNAMIVSGAASIPATGTINQGSPSFSSNGNVATATVASGSNGQTLTQLVSNGLSVTANVGTLPAAGAITVVTNVGTATLGYTSGGGTSTLSGISIISGTATWTVATAAVVTGIGNAYQNTDSLGNLIYNTDPYPSILGGRYFAAGTFSTTATAAVPVPWTVTPFIVPSGPSRLVKVWANLGNIGSSAAAGTTLLCTIVLNNNSSNIALSESKVQVASDGLPIFIQGFTQLASGSYTSQVWVTQGASGTMTVGTAFVPAQVGVELG